MTRRAAWTAGTVGAVILAAIVLMGAQSDPSDVDPMVSILEELRLQRTEQVAALRSIQDAIDDLAQAQQRMTSELSSLQSVDLSGLESRASGISASVDALAAATLDLGTVETLLGEIRDSSIALEKSTVDLTGLETEAASIRTLVETMNASRPDMKDLEYHVEEIWKALADSSDASSGPFAMMTTLLHEQLGHTAQIDRQLDTIEGLLRNLRDIERCLCN